MLENGVSTRKKVLFILQNLFLPDSLRDPQEADNKRAYFTRKKQKLHHRHYAEKQNNPSDQMCFMKTSAVHWSDMGERERGQELLGQLNQIVEGDDTKEHKLRRTFKYLILSLWKNSAWLWLLNHLNLLCTHGELLHKTQNTTSICNDYLK